MNEQELSPFRHVKMTEESNSKSVDVIDKFVELHELIMTLNPSRERSLAVTKLEEASRWATKSIAFNQ